eukprot:TRINITY_DN742_c0_g1_i1.p3 TRINITY_DN742_c0_g1~~TRINITY_DN742_c0_g1_i1.p3  ORF type:complete len:173 (-),score=72.02 TRINITY_DN742_c0_g1_i1:36-554(-)
MVQKFRNYTNRDGGSPQVVVITPPPVHERAWRERTQRVHLPDTPLDQVPLNRTLAHAKLYAEAAKRAADACNVPCVDIYHAMLNYDETDNNNNNNSDVDTAGEKWHALLSDGLHLSAAGGQFVFKQVRAALDAFPRNLLAVEAFKTQFPHHLEIDAENWKKNLDKSIPLSWL